MPKIRSWEESYDLLSKIKDETGSCHVSLASDKNLCFWVWNQRKRKAKLSIERKSLLDKVGFDWTGNEHRDRKWEEMFQKLLKYKRKFGNLKVPTKYEGTTELSAWVSNQRRDHKLHRLNEHRFKRLDDIGFQWTTQSTSEKQQLFLDQQWHQHYDNLCAFYEIYGHCDVQSKHGDQKLYNWVLRQRKHHSGNYLRKDRKDLLDEIQFTWKGNGHDGRWICMFDLLKDFKEEHGHFIVDCNSNEESAKLSNWVARQIERYNNRELTKKRIDLLKGINFDFSLEIIKGDLKRKLQNKASNSLNCDERPRTHNQLDKRQAVKNKRVRSDNILEEQLTQAKLQRGIQDDSERFPRHQIEYEPMEAEKTSCETPTTSSESEIDLSNADIGEKTSQPIESKQISRKRSSGSEVDINTNGGDGKEKKRRRLKKNEKEKGGIGSTVIHQNVEPKRSKLDIPKQGRYADSAKKSNMHMKKQGFLSEPLRGRFEPPIKLPPNSRIEDKEKLKVGDKTFKRNRCYRTSSGKIVGIVKFFSREEAECALIVRFKNTFLGETKRRNDPLPEGAKVSRYFRVKGTETITPFSTLVERTTKVKRIPKWIYEPQMPGQWYNFAYYYENKGKRCGRRSEFALVDLFSGSGLMGDGFEQQGFSVAFAVDNDPNACRTYDANHTSPAHCMDVNDFLRAYESYQRIDRRFQKHHGRISHLHASSPCQGFSEANRCGGKNDEVNNSLSHAFADGVKIIRPVTATFENVLGMWRRKNVKHLHKIVGRLMGLGYQVRCGCLDAADYGDPQKRERLFLFAADSFADLPQLPVPTHGSEQGQIPFATVEDALEGLQATCYKVDAAVTTRLDRREDSVQLQAGEPARTVCATSEPPFHYKEDRMITVEEAAALQSFPSSYRFVGTQKERRKQIGNAVPLQLATAVAGACKAALSYKFGMESGSP